MGNLARVSGSDEGVEVSRASAITVTFGFDDPASNSSPRLQIFFTQFEIFVCLRQSTEPIERNSNKDLVGSSRISLFFFLWEMDNLRMDEGCDELTHSMSNVRSSYN